MMTAPAEGRSNAGGRRRLAALLSVIAFLAAGASSGRGQTITVSGDPATITINSAVAGQDPLSVSTSSTTYRVTGSGSNIRTKITARVDSPLPPGVTLSIALASPGGGAQSLGPVALTATPQDVVRNIPGNANQSGLAITYQLSALVSAGTTALLSTIVTLQISQ